MDIHDSPQEKAGSSRLLDYVDLPTLKDILSAFTTATGLMANIVDQHGRSIFSRKDVEKCCKFCRIIFSVENGLKRCQQAYERAGKQAAIFREPYIFRCPSGLIEFAAPLIINEEHVGTIICGQVLMWEPEDFFWVELREMNKNIDVDFQELFQAVDELPVVSGPQVQAAAYLLYVTANYIVNAGWKSYQHAKQVEISQSLLYGEIENRRDTGKQPGYGEKDLSLITERDMTAALLGSERDKNTYFQKLVAAFRYEADKNLIILRSRVTEMLVILSRVSAKTGVRSAELAPVSDKYIRRLYEAENEEAVIIAANEAVECCCEMIKSLREMPYNINVRAMIAFMEENYSQGISLDDIAGAAMLSPSYASRLFKQISGVSIVDYLMRLRVDNAKRHLLNPHYQIDEIASNVGYNDSSYFTKTFKRLEGITPTEFRRRSK